MGNTMRLDFTKTKMKIVPDEVLRGHRILDAVESALICENIAEAKIQMRQFSILWERQLAILDRPEQKERLRTKYQELKKKIKELESTTKPDTSPKITIQFV